jgi:dolichyl-phosphate-mannose-protein mannosyltransferase
MRSLRSLLFDPPEGVVPQPPASRLPAPYVPPDAQYVPPDAQYVPPDGQYAPPDAQYAPPVGPYAPAPEAPYAPLEDPFRVPRPEPAPRERRGREPAERRRREPAERRRREPAERRPDPVRREVDSSHRGRWALAVAGILLLAFGLRIWGIKTGLPYAYNSDENAHFVPRAIGLFGHNLNPGYFNNPPAYTYLLYIIYGIWYGGGQALSHTFASNPTEVWVIARATAAVLGTLAVWLLYLCGARLFDRRTGLLAAGLMAVAFLPVFYAHLALNDVPTLAPLTLSLWGTAGVLRFGRLRDYIVAGIGLGLASATKYTGGIILLPLVAAAVYHYRSSGGNRAALVGIATAGTLALIAFVFADPYAVLDFSAFHSGIAHQSAASDDSTGKLGLTHGSGITYYLWTLTWGLGWVPALAALGGAIALWWDERRLILVLVPAVIVFLLFMGTQGRYFGRWLMPVLPIFCLLSAYALLQLADRIGRSVAELRPTMIALAVVALCGQGVVHSVHSGLVDSRADTRNEARAYMVAHIPIGTHIVVEPVVPDQWASDIGHVLDTVNGARWIKYPATHTQMLPDGTLSMGAGPVVNIEDYEKTLQPALIPLYESHGYCYVVTGETQFGRADVDPGQVPQAIAYYKALAQQGTLIYSATPYGPKGKPVGFNFDWTFDYYPLAYSNPGPVMNIYHLTGGKCAAAPPATSSLGGLPLPSSGG